MERKLSIEEYHKQYSTLFDEFMAKYPLFPGYVAGDDPEIKRGKPAPDPFLTIMNRFEEKAESLLNILVFEDSANSGRATIAASMQVIMVLDITYMKPPE
ncbi:unnamed protein product [Acanthocheilonema viteae]|uniref:Uncharacterized protein n=1 Tax=Acanthocheilonema viteae TaxID=6277 RepID=A0A498SGF0_ACAVI|nr:unnamed protein product [Acanthocheilonema viteae]